MIQKIYQSGDPVLRLVAKKVLKIDKKVVEVVKDLKDTLAAQKEPEGVGLAAPQIGKSLRIFLAKYKELERLVINPEILEMSKKKPSHFAKATRGKEILEGCLSLPHYYGPLKRASKIKIKYLNELGKEIIEEFSDFNAQIIMHEIDHLNGVLFVDRLLEEKRPLYHVEGKKWEEVELLP